MEGMGQQVERWVLASCLIFAAALGQMIPALFCGGMPQVPGENVLALVLGDARQELSAVLLDKVEEYFHGGVRGVACDEGLSEQGHEHGHEEHGHEHEAPPPGGSFDPWGWINRRVHEQVDRHLTEDRAVELLPWVWASCRASPNNVQAFQVGSFILSSMVGKPEEGLRLLEEGVRKNPACAELDFTLGELLLNKLHAAARAEPWFLSAREKSRPAEGPAGEEARVLKVRTLFYLGYLAKRRGEMDRVGAYAEEAEALAPGHVCARDLRKMLTDPK